MPRIPQEIVDQIHSAADIYEVVSDFVPLKKSGRNYSAKCPFHDEKTPSFSVVQSRGFFKCFSCGKGGDSITFIREHEGLNYYEALVWLAKKYGIEIPAVEWTDEEQAAQNERESILIVNNFAKNHFVSNLIDTDEGRSIGLSYFKERGFSDTTIEKFELGYSQAEFNAFTNAAIAAGYQRVFLEKSGVSIEKDGKYYDRFRGRVMFPIHNASGKVIAFGGRIMSLETKMAKYINSPETEIYHKSDVLYGLFQAKNQIRNEENCILVEGYTDVISLFQAGLENVVSSSGTSLTEGQIKLIGRYSKHITMLYDGDAAGLKASLRGVDLILEKGLNVNVVALPEKEDPDSFAKRIGGPALKEYIKANAENFIAFKSKLLLQESNNDPVKKASVINDVMLSISKVNDIVQRAVYLKECVKLLEIDESVLVQVLNNIKANRIAGSQSISSERQAVKQYIQGGPAVKQIHKKSETHFMAREAEVLRLLINFGNDKLKSEETVHAYLLVQMEEIEFQNPIYKRMIDMYKEENLKGNLANLEFFNRSQDEEIRKAAIKLCSQQFEPSESWRKFHIRIPTDLENLDSATFAARLRMEWKHIQGMIKENKTRMKDCVDEEELTEKQKIHLYLKNLEMGITSQLGVVVY